AARAPAGDPEIEPLAREVAQDLRPGRVAVIFRIGLVLELTRQKPTMFLRQLFGLAHHAGAAFRGRRQDYLGAEHAHDLAALDREALGHDRNERITLRRAHHRERDAGVAGGRLDDGLAALERAAPLGVFDDCDRQAVL